VKQASLSHLFTAFVVVCVIALDQWTKALVVEHLGPPNSGRIVPLLGEYLTLYYIQNKDSAMGLLTKGILLTVLIVVAIVILISIYIRISHSMPLISQLFFGMILGGAAGNLIDRVHYNGSVVDFLFFRLPQLGFQFYIFNLADAAISVGIGFLLVFVFFARLRKTRETSEGKKAASTPVQPTSHGNIGADPETQLKMRFIFATQPLKIFACASVEQWLNYAHEKACRYIYLVFCQSSSEE